MIIRRISDTLRRQDWTMVFVELIMVVIGIFLGIEAANWNEDRRDSLEEKAYLMRLHEDVQDSIAALRSGRSDVVRWNDRGREALKALQENDRSLAGEERGFAFAASTRIGLPSTQLATITELISSGRLNEISDPEIRAQLAEIDGRIKSLDDHIRILVDYVVPVSAAVQTRLRPAFGDASQWSMEDWDREVTYDFDALSNDEEFQNALGFALRLQR
jgi:hypothetical protein